MARTESMEVISLPAGADLSAASNQYRALKLSSGAVVLQTASTLQTVGVLQNLPELGRLAEVAISGIVKIKCGAAVSQDDRVMIDATGRAVTATSTNRVLGIALEAGGAADVVIEVLLVSQAVL